MANRYKENSELPSTLRPQIKTLWLPVQIKSGKEISKAFKVEKGNEMTAKDERIGNRLTLEI